MYLEAIPYLDPYFLTACSFCGKKSGKAIKSLKYVIFHSKLTTSLYLPTA
ncbi:hypothetical protein [Lactobacillus delbrueckii]|nr:hypothetical protein [Lactobacillus delbrueckii]